MAAELTIGMATFNDAPGVWFTIQNIRLQNPELLDRLEFVVIDNNPHSPHGEELRNFIPKVRNARLVPRTLKQGTSVRNAVFEQARGRHVLCLDCHVLLRHGVLGQLLQFFREHPDSMDLYQGPLWHDDMGADSIETQFDPVWSDRMFGTWGKDSRGIDPEAAPFEIPSQGLGLFACRKDAWLGFHRLFRGFGGEEGYIHEKYRQAGRRCWCLPFLRWVHCFMRPNRPGYPNRYEDRAYNYFVGWHELGLPEEPILNHFQEKIPRNRLLQIQAQAHQDLRKPPVVESPEPVTGAEHYRPPERLVQHLLQLPPQQQNRSLTALRRSNEAVYRVIRAKMEEAKKVGTS